MGYWAWDWLSGRPEHVVIHGSVGLLAGSSSDRLELDMAMAHFVIHPKNGGFTILNITSSTWVSFVAYF